MAEITYYFDQPQTGAEWTDAPYMVDNNLTTFGYTSSNGAVHGFTENTCPGTDLGTITKVELRAYGYGDGNDRIDLRPFGNEYQVTMPSSPGWGAYVDITNDINAPDWSLWAHIVNQNCDIIYQKVGKGNIIYCAKGEIRVTYTEVGAKVTQYLAGNDCPGFPYEMDLESDKLPCPPPY